jgi:hypothetical protein
VGCAAEHHAQVRHDEGDVEDRGQPEQEVAHGCSGPVPAQAPVREGCKGGEHVEGDDDGRRDVPRGAGSGERDFRDKIANGKEPA